MNDFTKEELEDMHYGLVEYGELESVNVIKLSNKLQSMIDNYCEHKETEMDCDGGISLVCKTCGETTMDVM